MYTKCFKSKYIQHLFLKDFMAHPYCSAINNCLKAIRRGTWERTLILEPSTQFKLMFSLYFIQSKTLPFSTRYN